MKNLVLLFPHVITAENNRQIVHYANGMALEINRRVLHLYGGTGNEASYKEHIQREKHYKRCVSENLKISIRDMALYNPLFFVQALDEETQTELKEWLKLLEDGVIVPKVEIEWHRLAPEWFTWTVVSVEWVYSDTEEKAGKVEGEAASSQDALQNLPAPLNTPKARRMFEVFMEAGYVRVGRDGHLEWAAAKNATKCPVAFAYFVERASDYLGLTIKKGTPHPRYVRKPFEELFEIYETSKKSGIRMSLNTQYEIDKLFRRLEKV